ncbi:unnamed protein product, partial [Didymodactylos carnosus]
DLKFLIITLKTKMDHRFRIVGDVSMKTKSIMKARKVEINYGKKNSEELGIIQIREPLTTELPYFLVHVTKCDPDATIAIGIASPDIDNHAGLYNNSIGYHSITGRVYSSYKVHANTLGVPYGKDDTIGLYVTYFGNYLSTTLFYLNKTPVATRYHFESKKERYLPTITFSGGRIDVAVLWQQAVDQLPSVSDIPISQWIRAPMSTYNSQTTYFENPSKLEDLPVQSPIPLGKSFRYFVVTQQDVLSSGKGASVGLATCSPLKPTPTCSLLKDYYTWYPKLKMKVGNTIGWGVFYDEECQDDKAEQLCLVYVMFNSVIVDALFVLQPDGGFMPVVLLQPYATKVSIEKMNTQTKEDLTRLQTLYKQMLGPAVEVYEKDVRERELVRDYFRQSEHVSIIVNSQTCVISIPKNESGTHYVQFLKPLTYDRRFFFVELEQISEQSQIIIGVASSKNSLSKLPGLVTDTVGYHSSEGKLYYNNKDVGNMKGHVCKRGDTMGIEIEVFDKDMSVALFSKNFRPVGTRFLTLQDHSEFMPTIMIESYGEPIELLVYWHTRVSVPPHFSVRNAEDWCIPEGTKVDIKEKVFQLPPHFDTSSCIQAPYSLHRKYNHFEIVLIDKFSENNPPPAIALCTASPLDPPPKSQFKQDYLRFWPTGDAAKYIKQGDRLGWGIMYPDETIAKEEEQLVICYLTVNRNVGYVRVLFQPPGGLYPVVIAPPNVTRIKMDFSGTRISTQDFTDEQVKSIISDARRQIEEEHKHQAH